MWLPSRFTLSYILYSIYIYSILLKGHLASLSPTVWSLQVFMIKEHVSVGHEQNLSILVIFWQKQHCTSVLMCWWNLSIHFLLCQFMVLDELDLMQADLMQKDKQSTVMALEHIALTLLTLPCSNAHMHDMKGKKTTFECGTKCYVVAVASLLSKREREWAWRWVIGVPQHLI